MRSCVSVISRAVGLWMLGALTGGGPVVAQSSQSDGDPVRGEMVYGRCAACHSLEYNRTGPLHCGIIGRRAGTVDGFSYSEAMRASDIVWSRTTLDRFLESPVSMVPGTTMGYAGISEARDRLDLIAYLEQAGRSSAICGSMEK